MLPILRPVRIKIKTYEKSNLLPPLHLLFSRRPERSCHVQDEGTKAPPCGWVRRPAQWLQTATGTETQSNPFYGCFTTTSGMASFPTEKWVRGNYVILEVSLCNICFQIKPWKKPTQATGDCGEEGGSRVASSANASVKFKPARRFLQIIWASHLLLHFM